MNSWIELYPNCHDSNDFVDLTPCIHSSLSIIYIMLFICRSALFYCSLDVCAWFLVWPWNMMKSWSQTIEPPCMFRFNLGAKTIGLPLKSISFHWFGRLWVSTTKKPLVQKRLFVLRGRRRFWCFVWGPLKLKMSNEKNLVGWVI